MDRQISIDEVDFSNQDFWSFYCHVNFPNGYDEEADMSVGEMTEELIPLSKAWVDTFTQYYEGVLDECDGYLEHPTTLTAPLNDGEVLKIAFHPGDVMFFINDKQIGCTGPHHMTQSYPYEKLERLLDEPQGELLFLLLLPMARVEADCSAAACQTIARLLQHIFPASACQRLAQCIVQALIPD